MPNRRRTQIDEPGRQKETNEGGRVKINSHIPNIARIEDGERTIALVESVGPASLRQVAIAPMRRSPNAIAGPLVIKLRSLGNHGFDTCSL